MRSWQMLLLAFLVLTAGVNVSQVNQTTSVNVSSTVTNSSFDNVSATPKCIAVHFKATLFSQPSGPSSYGGKSNQAHIVLGLFLFAMVTVWTAFVVGFLRNLRHCFLLSGSLQSLMGCYLLVWVFFILHPGDLAALWHYSTHDILQLQHIAIALLLVGAGAIELLHGYFRLLTSVNWHDLWGLNSIFAGLIFLLHPQTSAEATTKHVLLGTFLVLASVCFLLSKREQFKNPPGSEDFVDWPLVSAGGFYIASSFVLLLFREEDKTEHYGTSPHCQGAFSVVLMSYGVAALTISLSFGVALWTQCHKRKRLPTSSRHERVPLTVLEL